MKITPTEIENVLLIEELSLGDVETFPLRGIRLNQWRYSGEEGAAFFSRTKLAYGNVRGLHFQRGQYAQTRVVRVFAGKIFDVILDMRKDSSTFGQHVRVSLEEGDGRGVLVPVGCAHGFSVLSGEADVGIWWDGKFNSRACGGVFSGDNSLNIDWGISLKDRIISSYDSKKPIFRELFSIQEKSY